MSTKIEKVILQNLANDDEFMRKVIPFLKQDYFLDNNEKIIYQKISKFIDEYNAIPSKDALVIAVQNDKSLNEDQYKEVVEYIHDLDPTDHNKEWLYKETEKFCKDKAIYNAILSSIAIIDGRDKAQSEDGIPQLLQDAIIAQLGMETPENVFEN
jgi:replicative DNA helicase